MSWLNLILIKYLGICVFFDRTNVKLKVEHLSIHWLQKMMGLVLISVLVQGCVTKPNPANITDINQLAQWNARGKLLIKNSKDKLSGYFFWQQQKNGDFKLVITSFIGTSLMTMQYQQGLAEVIIDGKTQQGTNPELLIYQLTGSYIPVSNMANWMLAKAPSSASTTVEQGQLKSFNYQDSHLNNWQINYQSYQNIALLTLPKQLTINGLGSRIKLTVNDWELLAP